MTSRWPLQIAAASIVALTAASPASAQLINPPARQARPPIQGAPASPRATNELIFEANLLGGLDQNPVSIPSGFVPISSLQSNQQRTAYMGTVDSALTFSRGSGERSFSGRARSYMNAYRNVGLEPAFGGDAGVNAETTLGRRNKIEANASGQNAPFFSLGLFGPFSGVGGNPTAAFTNGRTWTVDGASQFKRDWTRNTATSVRYAYGRTGYTGISIGGAAAGGSVGPFNNDSHTGSVDFERKLGRSMSSKVLYAHVLSRSVQVGGVFRPTTHDRLEGEMNLTRELSRTRQFGLTLGGGAAYVQTYEYISGLPYDYYAPVFHGATNFDFNRTWSARAEYRRNVNVIPGLSTNQQSFVSHNGSVGLGGSITSLVEFALTAAYSNGHTGTVAVLTGSTANKYEAYTGTAELQFQLTNWWAALVNVSHVETRLNSSASQALGLLPQVQRTSLRVGLSWMFPLIGDRSQPIRPRTL